MQKTVISFMNNLETQNGWWEVRKDAIFSDVSSTEHKSKRHSQGCVQ